MNSTTEVSPANSPEDQLAPTLLTEKPRGFFGTAIDWLVEQFSSILVKESRQAIKSLQFVGTFGILILAVTGWTLKCLTDESRGVGWGDDFANGLFCGYLMILGLPCIIIVPFTAFRSLAREYEDGTIQLISITTMKPYQIVVGKLMTAMLQMVIYLSVVAPCIAFITFLDGITLTQIVIALLVMTIGCFCLTVLGLLLAGASRSYTVGMGISTLLILGYGGIYLVWYSFVQSTMGESRNFSSGPDPQLFYMACFVTIAFFICTALVLLAAAAAQISFPTDNRSTLPRLALLFQLIFFFAAVAMFAYVLGNPSVPLFVAALAFIGHYWLLFGALICGESGDYSRRVLRGMPTTIIGRSFWSLLMPGPGRGYLFCVTCMLSCSAVVFIAQFAWEWLTLDSQLATSQPMLTPMIASQFKWSGFGFALIQFVLIMAYPLMFLSIIYLVMSAFRAVSKRKLAGAGGPVLGFLVGLGVCLGITISASAMSSFSNTQFLSIAEAWSWYEAIPFAGQVNYNIMMNNMFAANEDLFKTMIAMMIYNGVNLAPVLMTSFVVTSLACFLACREFFYGAMSTPDRVSQDRAIAAANPVVGGETIDETLGLEPDQVDEED